MEFLRFDTDEEEEDVEGMPPKLMEAMLMVCAVQLCGWVYSA